MQNSLFNLLYLLDSISIVNRFLIRYFPKEMMIKGGAVIGDGGRWMSNFYCTEPFLLRVGREVSVGLEVQFITHEGGTWVLRGLTGNKNIEQFGRITIGDNVFIGNRTTIFPGITVGSNVIIGAGSIVTKDIPSGVVVAGVPAKVIRTIEEFEEMIGPTCIYSRSLKGLERVNAILESVDRIEGIK